MIITTPENVGATAARLPRNLSIVPGFNPGATMPVQALTIGHIVLSVSYISAAMRRFGFTSRAETRFLRHDLGLRG